MEITWTSEIELKISFSIRGCVYNKKTDFLKRRRDGQGCWAACREAACQRINETLPKDLER